MVASHSAHTISISIHVLSEEDDRAHGPGRAQNRPISIHVLREEDDRPPRPAMWPAF